MTPDPLLDRSIRGPALAWVLSIVALLVYEAWRLAQGRPPLTAAMREWSSRLLIRPAGWGALAVHFFGESSLPQWCAWLLVPAGLAILARDLFVGSSLPAIDHLAVLVLFVGLGAWLWGAR